MKGRAGSKLMRLHIRLPTRANVEYERLVIELVDILDAGGLPLVRSWPSWIRMGPAKCWPH